MGEGAAMSFVIIGNSAAGTAAIESIRRHDRSSRIIQLSDEAQPLYSRCLLSYYLSDTIDKKGLLFRESDFHREMNVDLHTGPGSRAVELDTNGQKVTCENGDTFAYDKLLIATGASAKLPDTIPKGIDGVFVLRNLADVEAIKKSIPNAKNAVVLGGGLIGMKAAAALNTRSLKTTVIIRSNHVLSQMIDDEAADIIKQQMDESNIDVLTQTDVAGLRTQDHRLTGVETGGGQVLDCDLLIVAKGVTPNTELVHQTPIEKNWGIKTNSYMQTGIENVFAAGDVAETFDIAIEEYTVNALWTCAVQQGRIAGLNMAGKKTAYNGAIGMNSLNVIDTCLISFGITSPKDVSKYKILALNQPERRVYKKFVISGDNRIKGIIMVGKIANAGVLLSLIQRKVDVSPFEEELLSDHFNIGTLLKYGVAPSEVFG